MVLGAEHAAEHAHERAAQAAQARRWRQMSPSEAPPIGDARFAARPQLLATGTESTVAPPSEVGRWTPCPLRDPPCRGQCRGTLPTGEVMFWGPSFPDEPRNLGNGARGGPLEGFRRLWRLHGGATPLDRPGRPRPSGDGHGADLLLGAVDAPQRQGPDHRRQPRLAGSVRRRRLFGQFAGLNRVFTFQPVDQDLD